MNLLSINTTIWWSQNHLGYFFLVLLVSARLTLWFVTKGNSFWEIQNQLITSKWERVRSEEMSQPWVFQRWMKEKWKLHFVRFSKKFENLNFKGYAQSLPSKTIFQDLADICFIQGYYITPWKSKIIPCFCFQEPNSLKLNVACNQVITVDIWKNKESVSREILN